MKRLLSGIVFFLGATAALAQQYPTRSVTLMVPYAPGPTDTVARIVAQSMQKPLGESIIVENRPSAGGILAPELVKNAKPDGYTILIHHIGMATTPALYRNLRFNPLTDFEYIGLINDVPMTLIGKAQLPANNFKELLAYIKANKDKVNFAHAGIGAASQLCGMLFMSSIQTELLTVPYKGTGPAMNDLLGGQVDLLCDQTTQTAPVIKDGNRVKVFGVTTPQRLASLPNIPTLDEQGLKGFELVVWNGLFAPKGTPKPVLDRVLAALQAAVRDPAFGARLADLGAEPVPPAKVTPASLRELLGSEIDKWTPIIRKSGVYAD
jgi:tripartite-type tricarboxylate transporter receptor subunit TctC